MDEQIHAMACSHARRAYSKIILFIFFLNLRLPGFVFSMTNRDIMNERSFVLFYLLVGSLKMNTTLEYSTRVVQEGDRRCKKSTLNDLAYLTPLRIPLMNPVYVYYRGCVILRIPSFLAAFQLVRERFRDFFSPN
jgi:hypothetical protein